MVEAGEGHSHQLALGVPVPERRAEGFAEVARGLQNSKTGVFLT